MALQMEHRIKKETQERNIPKGQNNINVKRLTGWDCTTV